MPVDSIPLIQVRGLRTYFYTDDGIVRAVDGVDLVIHPGKVLGIIGETGSGKTVLALSIMRLIQPPGRIVEGSILYTSGNGKEVDLARLDPRGKAMRDIRGKHISMIFQEPMVSLNPVYTIGEQIVENITTHQNVTPKEARAMAIAMLEQVGIPEPNKRIDDYPHELSGGMRQRAMIAMALACRPRLLIADEPTTALDVTVQAQILELLKNLQKQMGMAIMIITHNLGVIAEIADFVGVMYLGRIMEYADLQELFENPLHPYTRDLFRSIPYCVRKKDRKRLEVIRGDIPDPYTKIEGCPYASRCSQVFHRCSEEPPVIEVRSGHIVRCWCYG